jgi:hypothetical protein
MPYGSTIVVTHYAPSPQSPSVFHGSLLEGGFVTDLEPMIRKHEPTLGFMVTPTTTVITLSEEPGFFPISQAMAGKRPIKASGP